MDIYLPIAEVSLDIFLLLGLGAAVGFLSGVFGVGGGFLLTPLLIFAGVPAPIAVASSANQLGAGSLILKWASRCCSAALPVRSWASGCSRCLLDSGRSSWRSRCATSCCS